MFTDRFFQQTFLECLPGDRIRYKGFKRQCHDFLVSSFTLKVKGIELFGILNRYSAVCVRERERERQTERERDAWMDGWLDGWVGG